jgi:hypothetical protein
MRRLAVPLLLVALVAPAEASAYTPPPVQYTAAISGTDAFVGIVKRGDRFRAYVSDAIAKRVTLSVWFRGAIDSEGHLAASAHGVGLEADLGPGSATGTMTLPDGRSLHSSPKAVLAAA